MFNTDSPESFPIVTTFQHDIWDQIKHITCFVSFFSESVYGQYMNIYMNWSRKVAWKWGQWRTRTWAHPTSSSALAVLQENKTPSSPFPPKVQTSGSPLCQLWTVCFQKGNMFFASTVNQIQNGLSSTTVQQQRKVALYSCKQSTHQKLLQKSRDIKRNTLITIHLCLLRVFPKEANIWQIITLWREGWSRQHWSPLFRVYNRGGIRRNRAVATSKILPSVALFQTDSVSDWGSPVLADVPLSKPQGWGVQRVDKLTWHSLVNPARSWPCQVKPALFPTECGGCRAAHHLHLLERWGKGCRGSGQQSSLRTAHWDVLCWVAFLFPWEDLTNPGPISSQTDRKSHLAVSEPPSVIWAWGWFLFCFLFCFLIVTSKSLWIFLINYKEIITLFPVLTASAQLVRDFSTHLSTH